MKAFLVFKKDGEIIEEKVNYKGKLFEPEDFSEFKHYRKYDNYIVLYNEFETLDYNITVFPFTEDKFKGDVALIKIDKNNSIKDLTVNNYFKIMSKVKVEPNEMYYSSEEDDRSFSF